VWFPITATTEHLPDPANVCMFCSPVHTTGNTPPPETMDTIKQIEQFTAELNRRFSDYRFSVESGRKNARIVQCAVNPAGVVSNTRSVYCFVRLEDGAVLKSASWKTPAKGVRAWLSDVLASDLAGVDQFTGWLYRGRR